MKDYPIKIYIAGKVTGNPNYKVDFANLKEWLKHHYPSAIILNPATLPEGMTAADYMRICLAMIDSADLVVFSSDSKKSAGARLESIYCEYVDKMYITMLRPAKIIIHCPHCKRKPEVGNENGKYFLIDRDTGCPVCGGFTNRSFSETDIVNDWNVYASIHYALSRKKGGR